MADLEQNMDLNMLQSAACHEENGSFFDELFQD